MVGLEVGLEDMADRSACCFRELQVVIDMLEMRIAHGELTFSLSAKEVGCAARRGMEYLAKDHSVLPAHALELRSVGNPAAAHSG